MGEMDACGGMMASNSDSPVIVNGGVGFGGLLTIVFIVLKLLGVISWSWLWVLAPTWIPMGIGLILYVIAALFVGIAWLVNK